MAPESKPSGKSRRKFLKDIGTGVIGTYVITPNVKIRGESIKKEYTDALEGKIELSVEVNGKRIKRKIKPSITLAEFLREDLGLTGTKLVCNHGECGSCTVLLNDKPVYSCHMLALDADKKRVLTIEGLLSGEKLNQIQQSFIDNDGLQCGFCTPGQIMSAYAIIKNNTNPTDEDILKGMSGNLFRCGAYPKIIDSVKEAVKINN
jgi:aerobic-type carbon monoxide dehydrogenase small subunit (CoxS/CutS family)